MLSAASVAVAVRIIRVGYRDEVRDVARKPAVGPREVDRVLARGEGLHHQVVPRVDAGIEVEAIGKAKDVVRGEDDLEQWRFLEVAVLDARYGDDVDCRGEIGGGRHGAYLLADVRLRSRRGRIVWEREVAEIEHGNEERLSGRHSARAGDGGRAEAPGEEPDLAALAVCALRPGCVEHRVRSHGLRERPLPPLDCPFTVALAIGFSPRRKDTRLVRIGEGARGRKREREYRQDSACDEETRDARVITERPGPGCHMCLQMNRPPGVVTGH